METEDHARPLVISLEVLDQLEILMNEKQVFDLSVPTSRTFKLIFSLLGLTHVLNGLTTYDRYWSGLLIVLLGVLVVVVALSLKHLNRYTIELSDSTMRINRGWFSRKVWAWETLNEVRIELMRIEIELGDGKVHAIHFGDLSYELNQTVKPQFVSALKEGARAKGIQVVDS